MKSHFEDSIPFIKPQDIRVMVETPKTFDVVPNLERIHFTQYLRDLIRPEEPLWSTVWGTSWKPGLLSRYQDNESVCWIFDDYGDLVNYDEPDEDGVIDYITPPPFCTNVNGNDWALCVFVMDDYGDVWVWDHEDEENDYYMCPLQEDGVPHGIFDQNGYLMWSLPNFMKLPKLIPSTIHEHGWDVLHHHATLDGMLCVRWLGLYGDVGYNHVTKTWGFNGDRGHFWDGFWNGHSRNSTSVHYSRRYARKMLEFETSATREVPAEIFPMETGSLLARFNFDQENKTVVGLVIDPMQSELRRIYAQDCYSNYNEDSGQLEASREYLEYWEGWSGARAAYESLPLKKRLRRTYTEGFVRESTPCAVVVYGKEDHLDAYQQSWVKKFRKNGFPIYFLQPMEN